MAEKFTEREFSIATTNVLKRLVGTLKDKGVLSPEECRHFLDLAAATEDSAPEVDKRAGELVKKHFIKGLGLDN